MHFPLFSHPAGALSDEQPVPALPRRFSFAPLLAVISLASCNAYHPVSHAPSAAAASVFAEPWIWTDEHGANLSLSRFRGRPFVLTAIYTSCTERCPLTVQKLRILDTAFQRHGGLVPIVLLTLDPRMDTPERLFRFKSARGLPEHWHFLRGDVADTHGLGRYLQVRAMYDDTHIDHDVRIVVFDAEGRVAHDYRGWTFDITEAISAR